LTTNRSICAYSRYSQQELGVPIVIDILTLGFDGDGAYKLKLQLSKLEEIIQTSFNRYCPTIWDTKQEAGICYYITYNVVKLAEHGQASRADGA
jgi:hypothetical protein